MNLAETARFTGLETGQAELGIGCEAGFALGEARFALKLASHRPTSGCASCTGTKWSMPTEVELVHVSHRYGHPNSGVEALRDVSLAIQGGEFVAVMGPSGCGKTTLLNLVGGMDRPTEGDILVGGDRINQFSEGDLTLYRRDRVGFIFQFFNLLPTLSILENVAMPLLLAEQGGTEATERSAALLEQVGLGDRFSDLPHQFSGGQMQRVAIARALVHEPSVILADEPTGNLDSANGEGVLQLLHELSRAKGVTVLLATHSSGAAAFADRVLELKDGQAIL